STRRRSPRAPGRARATREETRLPTARQPTAGGDEGRYHAMLRRQVAGMRVSPDSRVQRGVHTLKVGNSAGNRQLFLKRPTGAQCGSRVSPLNRNGVPPRNWSLVMVGQT